MVDVTPRAEACARIFQSVLFSTRPSGPILYLCCAPEAGDSTGIYLHLMARKQASQSASDPANGARLWEASQAMVDESRPRLAPRRRPSRGDV